MKSEKKESCGMSVLIDVAKNVIDKNEFVRSVRSAIIVHVIIGHVRTGVTRLITEWVKNEEGGSASPRRETSVKDGDVFLSGRVRQRNPLTSPGSREDSALREARLKKSE